MHDMDMDRLKREDTWRPSRKCEAHHIITVYITYSSYYWYYIKHNGVVPVIVIVFFFFLNESWKEGVTCCVLFLAIIMLFTKSWNDR